MKNNSLGTSWVPARLVISVFAAGMVALFVWSIYALWERLERREGRPYSAEKLPPRPELDRVVESINKRLAATKISEYGVMVEGEPPAMRLTIATDHPNYFFDSTSYVIETGGDVRKIPTAGLCQLIDRIEQERNSPALDALDKINAEAELGPDGAKLKAAGPFRAVFEVLYALRGVTKIPKRQARILIKGYADDQKTDWGKNLAATPYHFDHIPVLFPMMTEKESLNPVNFRARPAVVTVPDPYKNEHLPDLRAAFFKQDFIEPFLRDCGGVDNIRVYILKGYEFRRHDPRERRVDVQIDLF